MIAKVFIIRIKWGTAAGDIWFNHRHHAEEARKDAIKRTMLRTDLKKSDQIQAVMLLQEWSIVRVKVKDYKTLSILD